MNLKLTTKRAIEFEKRTGKDLLKALEEIAQSGKISLNDIVELFIALGDNYTIEMFDAWEASLVDKLNAIVMAIKEYTQGKN